MAGRSGRLRLCDPAGNLRSHQNRRNCIDRSGGIHNIANVASLEDQRLSQPVANAFRDLLAEIAAVPPGGDARGGEA